MIMYEVFCVRPKKVILGSLTCTEVTCQFGNEQIYLQLLQTLSDTHLTIIIYYEARVFLSQVPDLHKRTCQSLVIYFS